MSERVEPAAPQEENKSIKPRVEPPPIYETGEDNPLFEAKELTTSTTSNELSHEERLNGYRLSRGMELVILCVVLIFLLSILSVFPWAQRSEVIPMALDTLKLITTTVVGFVFGSHTFSQRKNDNNK